MAGDSKNDDGIYRVDTVPPPAGEEDAYNAPTKVGSIGKAAIHEMMRQAEGRGSTAGKASAADKSATAETAPPRSARAGTAPGSVPGPPPLPSFAKPAPVEKIYEDDDDDDEGDVATRVNRDAQAGVPVAIRSGEAGPSGPGSMPAAPSARSDAESRSLARNQMLMIAFAAIALALFAYVLFRG